MTYIQLKQYKGTGLNVKTKQEIELIEKEIVQFK